MVISNSLWHTVISNFLWHTVISNFLLHAVISNFLWHTVTSNFQWHTVIRNFLWHTVISNSLCSNAAEGVFLCSGIICTYCNQPNLIGKFILDCSVFQNQMLNIIHNVWGSGLVSTEFMFGNIV